jgi:RAT1-interacting protein
MMMYYGYAFESYCTSATPTRTETGPARGGDPPGWSGDVDTNVQWCSVVKGKLGDIRMVIGGEVDCVRGGHYTLQCSRLSDLNSFEQESTLGNRTHLSN